MSSKEILRTYIAEAVLSELNRKYDDPTNLGDLFGNIGDKITSSISNKLIKLFSGGKAKLSGYDDEDDSPRESVRTFQAALAEWFQDAKDVGVDLSGRKRSEIARFATEKYAELIKKKVSPESAVNRTMSLLDRKYGK